MVASLFCRLKALFFPFFLPFNSSLGLQPARALIVLCAFPSITKSHQSHIFIIHQFICSLFIFHMVINTNISLFISLLSFYISLKYWSLSTPPSRASFQHSLQPQPHTKQGHCSPHAKRHFFFSLNPDIIYFTGT